MASQLCTARVSRRMYRCISCIECTVCAVYSGVGPCNAVAAASLVLQGLATNNNAICLLWEFILHSYKLRLHGNGLAAW